MPGEDEEVNSGFLGQIGWYGWYGRPARAAACALSLSRFFFASLVLVPIALLPACDQGPPPGTSSFGENQPVAPPATLPTYSFAPGLAEKHADVAAFIRTFLETCLAGDYSGYRRLVSRSRTPQSKERFQAIYHGLSRVEVEAIEETTLPDAGTPAFRVISTVHVTGERARAALRGDARRIAIVVFLEDGKWVMLPAPSKLQPVDEAQDSTSQPAEIGPEYPWDQHGDY
ncbi:MAG: hypothetical protein U1D55_03095 [Phycisphaerae bacterium]